jgi:hypothetical protein
MDLTIQEEKGSSDADDTGNLVPDSITSLLLNPQFINMMKESLLPSLVDGVKQSFSAHAELTNSEQITFTGNSAGSTSGDNQPSSASGSKKVRHFPELPLGQQMV